MGKNARLLIIDIILFANKKTILKSVITALELLKQNRHSIRYGGMSVVFTGEFLQLEPVCGG
jgi:hypothetical protein